jgi:hypothetical protein
LDKLTAEKNEIEKHTLTKLNMVRLLQEQKKKIKMTVEILISCRGVEKIKKKSLKNL